MEAEPAQEPKTEAAVAVEQALALMEEPMMPIRKTQQVVAEPALALVEEPMMLIRKAQQVTAVNLMEVLAARPQRMAPIPHRHLLEK